MATWFAGLRGRGLRTGILSNSGPGAREAEHHRECEQSIRDIESLLTGGAR